MFPPKKLSRSFKASCTNIAKTSMLSHCRMALNEHKKLQIHH